jgi:hypothetical protein
MGKRWSIAERSTYDESNVFRLFLRLIALRLAMSYTWSLIENMKGVCDEIVFAAK